MSPEVLVRQENGLYNSDELGAEATVCEFQD